MKKTIELDENDIQKILAQKFGCGPHHVLISVTEEYAGHGLSEHRVHKVKVIIKQEESVC